MEDEQAQPEAAAQETTTPAVPAPEAPQAPDEVPPPALMPGQLVPLNSVPNVFRVVKVPGALGVNQRTGERVQVFVLQAHTPMGVLSFFLTEDGVRDVGKQCAEAVGAGISIVAPNALDALLGREPRR